MITRDTLFETFKAGCELVALMLALGFVFVVTVGLIP